MNEGERGQPDSSAHLAAIIASSEDAIISKDLDGRITSWNPSAERLFGWSAAEAVGQPISIVIPPDRQAEEAAMLFVRAVGALLAAGSTR